MHGIYILFKSFTICGLFAPQKQTKSEQKNKSYHFDGHFLHLRSESIRLALAAASSSRSWDTAPLLHATQANVKFRLGATAYVTMGTSCDSCETWHSHLALCFPTWQPIKEVK